MKTIQLQKPGELVRIETDFPIAPGRGEARVRIHRIGVCGTDIHAFGGRQPFFEYPRILGHELGVEVLAVGEAVDSIRVGDRCSVEPYLNCGSCVACRRGKPNCCRQLRVLGVHVDGGMREELIVPAHKLHASAKLSFDQLALIETLGIGRHAVERAQVQSGESVLVIGAGPIGLAVMQFALEKGARVIAMDMNESRLEFCRQQLNVPHTIHSQGEDPLAKLAELTDGDLPTAVWDATGNPNSMARAFEFPAPGGRLVFVGLFQGDVSFHDPSFHRRELSLFASRNALSSDFAEIIQLVENGRIETNPWITHRGQFDEVVEAFPQWTRPENGVVKAMIEVS